MADFRIRVIVDPKGAKDGPRVVNRELKTIENRADRLRRTMARFFTFAAVAIGIRQLIRLTDTFVNYQNRLRLVTKDSVGLSQVMEDLFKISNRTRTAFEGTAEVFARLAINQKNLGRSQQELLNFTESLNQAIILSGASAREAKAGLIQLSQGLASNRLSGDELRSVLEQLPAVADVIARELGVARGELRRLGEEGKITAQVVLDGFKAAREELAERFATTIPTIGQSFQVLQNQILRFVGNVNDASGSSRMLSRIILALADNIEALARAAIFLGTVFAITLARKGIGAVLTALKALKIALLTNPITVLPTVLLAATAALITFSDQIQISRDGIANLQDLGITAFETLTAAAGQLARQVKDIAKAGDGFESGINTDLKDIALVAAGVSDTIAGVFAGAFEVVVLIWGRFPDVMKRLGELALKGLRDAVEFTVDAVLAILQTIGDTIISVTRGLQGVITNSFEAAKQAALGNVKAAKQFADDAIQSAKNAAQAIIDVPRIAAANLKKLQAVDLLPTVEITPEAEALGVAIAEAFDAGFLSTTGAVDLVNQMFDDAERKAEARREAERQAAGQRKRDDAGEGAVGRLSRQAEQLLRRISIQKQINEQQLLLNDLLDAGAISAALFAEEVENLHLKGLDASTALGDGFERAFIRMKQEAKDFATVAEDIVNVFADRATDAITEFAKTGQINFKEFASAILDDITRIIVRLLVVQALSAAFGGAGGFLSPAAGAASNLTGRQHGGPVQPGRSFVVGENGPEIFRPEQTGTIIPNEKDRPQPAPQVNVQVVNVDDPDLIPQAIDDGDSDEAIINVLMRNKDKVKQAVS